MLCRLCRKNEIAARSKWRCEECLRKNREGAKRKRDADRDGFNAKMRAWNKGYRQRNLEKIRLYEKEYKKTIKGKSLRRSLYEKKKDELRAYKEAWDRSHPEKLSAYYKKYNSNNPSRIINNHRRRTKSNFSWSDWIALCDKYYNRCLWCGKEKKLTIDHVVPVTKGGTNDIENLQPLCGSCNSKKNNKILDFRPFGSAIMEWT